MKRGGILTVFAIIIVALIILWSIYQNPPAPKEMENHESSTWTAPGSTADFI
ncbi:MAG: hypothetical protein ACYCX4_17665 [Bacillota bacterium]